ncbi:MAG TPA: phosphonate C-P lyase system protein PhnH [Streptosporangiaceae bacterium]|nr:phosphonate C-P lyase system protein PhnH [Streptosporangiaceae bacterium]
MSAGAASDRLSPLTSQAVFRVLLQSLARPGRVMALPGPAAGGGPGAEAGRGVGPGIVPLALAVVGSKVAVAGAPSWQARICRATGASAADLAEASLVAFYGTADPRAVSLLRRGSATVPEDGAKVGLTCDALTEGGPGETTLELSGPGVPGRARLGVDGVRRDVFDALRAANAMFPAGVDVWLIDERGMVAGLPRSTRQVVI